MYPTGGKLVLALVLIAVIETTRSVPTYQWTDNETGKMVICHQCPPGTFVAKHCTSRSATDCQPCPDKHYTQYWNYVDKCRFCNVICQNREQVKHECNATHNRVCECKPGYQRDSHFCVKVTEFDLLSSSENEFDRAVKQNVSDERPLENTEAPKHNKKPKKNRNLVKYLRDIDPEHPLLPQLLEVLNKAGLHSLEKKLKKKIHTSHSIQPGISS